MHLRKQGVDEHPRKLSLTTMEKGFTARRIALKRLLLY